MLRAEARLVGVGWGGGVGGGLEEEVEVEVVGVVFCRVIVMV